MGEDGALMGVGEAPPGMGGVSVQRPGAGSGQKGVAAAAAASAAVGAAGSGAAGGGVGELGSAEPFDMDMDEEEYEAARALGAANGLPEWRLALKRPRHKLTPKQRALDKVARYLDKFGDMFARPGQRAQSVAHPQKDKVGEADVPPLVWMWMLVRREWVGWWMRCGRVGGVSLAAHYGTCPPSPRGPRVRACSL